VLIWYNFILNYIILILILIKIKKLILININQSDVVNFLLDFLSYNLGCKMSGKLVMEKIRLRNKRSIVYNNSRMRRGKNKF